MTAYSLTVISIYNKKSVPVNQWFPHTTHNCVSATTESITTATYRTPTLQRSPGTIHERASATRNVQHQSNTRTSYKTFISNATHVMHSDQLFAIRTSPPAASPTPTTTEPKGDDRHLGYRCTCSYIVYISYISSDQTMRSQQPPQYT